MWNISCGSLGSSCRVCNTKSSMLKFHLYNKSHPIQWREYIKMCIFSFSHFFYTVYEMHFKWTNHVIIWFVCDKIKTKLPAIKFLKNKRTVFISKSHMWSLDDAQSQKARRTTLKILWHFVSLVNSVLNTDAVRNAHILVMMHFLTIFSILIKKRE